MVQNKKSVKDQWKTTVELTNIYMPNCKREHLKQNMYKTGTWYLNNISANHSEEAKAVVVVQPLELSQQPGEPYIRWTKPKTRQSQSRVVKLPKCLKWPKPYTMFTFQLSLLQEEISPDSPSKPIWQCVCCQTGRQPPKNECVQSLLSTFCWISALIWFYMEEIGREPFSTMWQESAQILIFGKA